MGRYISGDINTKLWFGVQSSAAADRFGVDGYQPDELYYYFDKSNLETVQKELQSIINKIGIFDLAKLKEFFDTHSSYNDQMIKEAGLLELWNNCKEDYADYELGCMIRDCVIKQGSCKFKAEL